MIKTHKLSKKFGNRLAVNQLTLDIPPGEVFGFLGPNGAGKTTTVRMLCSLIAPSSGQASVAGYRVGEEDHAIRRNVGILTETPGLYDRLSALFNLATFARLYEVSDVNRQVEKYLRLLGLWDRRHDPVGAFSKGMRQKLAIARALLHEPRVLFLDEPTAGLDPEASKLVRDFIAELRAEGRTIFMCTHNLDEADRLCDRVAVFNSSLRVVDTPQGLRRQLYGRPVVVQLSEAAEAYLGVVDAPYIKAASAEANSLQLQIEDPETNNPDLIRRLATAGAPIQFVREQQHSLEDIYLELIND